MRVLGSSLLRLVAVGAIALGGVACSDDGGDDASTTTAASPDGAVVDAKSATAFSPSEVTVAPGESVTWRFLQSGVPHDVQSVDDGPLDSGSPKDEGEYSFTFDEPGTYEYFCSVHPNMKGTVTVQ